LRKLILSEEIKPVDTYQVTIYMAGDINTAKRWLRKEVYERGLCVTIRPETFIYTGGEEEGFAVGFLNYPRFPSYSNELWARAKSIAIELVKECSQKSALLVSTNLTEWISIDPPGRR
jgi:hypothetical protein